MSCSHPSIPPSISVPPATPQQPLSSAPVPTAPEKLGNLTRPEQQLKRTKKNCCARCCDVRRLCPSIALLHNFLETRVLLSSSPSLARRGRQRRFLVSRGVLPPLGCLAALGPPAHSASCIAASHHPPPPAPPEQRPTRAVLQSPGSPASEHSELRLAARPLNIQHTHSIQHPQHTLLHTRPPPHTIYCQAPRDSTRQPQQQQSSCTTRARPDAARHAQRYLSAPVSGPLLGGPP